MMGSEAPAPPPPPICGVSLAHFAAVNAALAEGFALRQVLAVEKLERDAWGAADLAWTELIARDGAREGPVFARYRHDLARAEDRLVRAVVPLESDLEAWVAFQASYGRASAPNELLRVTGLRPNDLSRLGRRWDRMFVADSALARRAAELAKRAEVGLPAVAVAPAELRPSGLAAHEHTHDERARHALEARGLPAPEAERAPPAALALDRYAALCADLAVFPDDARVIFEKYGFATSAARSGIERAWKERLAREPALERDFRALYAHFRTQAESARRARTSAGAAPANTAVERYAARAEPVRAPVVAPNPDAGQTVDVAGWFEPALPFQDDDLAPEEVLRRALAHADRIQGPAPSGAHPDAGGTLEVSDVLARAAQQPAEQAPVAVAQAAETLDVGAILAGAALPFAEARPPAPPSADETLDVGALLASGPALPFEPAPASGARPRILLTPGLESGAQAPHPEAGGTLDVAAILAARREPEPPALSLEQYASLAVDLALRPEARALTLQRYRVSEAQKRALDEAWRARFDADPKLAAAYARACATYRAWLERAR